MGNANSRKTEMSEYRRRGSLTRRKLMEYIPTMVVTYLSILLINSADQVIAGNFIGPNAMNSISIFRLFSFL